MLKNPIIVWAWADALEALSVSEQFLLTHGGDEDWVAEVPPEYLDEQGIPWPEWLGEGTPFARCDIVVLDHPSKSRWKIVVGGHS